MITFKKGIFLHALSFIINKEIRYAVPIINLNKSEKKQDSDSKNDKIYELIALTESHIVIFPYGFSHKTNEINYSALKSIIIDKDHSSLIKLILSNLDGNSNFKENELIISVQGNRSKFIRELKAIYLLHKLHQLKSYFEQELTVTYESDIAINSKYPISLLKDHNAIIEQNMFERIPKNEILELFSIDDYLMFLPNNNIKEDNNIFINSNPRPFKIQHIIYDALPMENLISNPDKNEISIEAYSKAYLHIKKQLKLKVFGFTENKIFLKKQNYNKDDSQYEAWQISLRTEVTNKQGLNISYILLRRKFIPPFNETYQDMLFIFTEKFFVDNFIIEEQVSFTSEAKETIHTCINSITPRYYFDNYNLFSKRVCNIKLEGVYSGFGNNNVFHIEGIELFETVTLKFGMSFTLKLILLLEDFIKDKMKEIRKYYNNKVKEIYINVFNELNFDINLYEKKIRDSNFLKILEDYNIEVFRYFKEPSKELFELLILKRNYFLYWCLDGGLTNKLLNVEELVKLFGTSNDLNNYNYILEILLNVNLFPETINGKQISSKQISNFLTSEGVLSINQQLLCILIRSGFFKIVFKINDNQFSKMLSELLKVSINVQLLNSILIFISKHENDSIFESVHAWYGDLCATLIDIFKTNDNIIYTTIITQCLVYLTKKDKKNRAMILKSGCLQYLTSNLKTADENLLYNSLELISNLLPLIKENIENILSSNTKFLSYLKRIIKPTGIPLFYYSSRVINITLSIFNYLIQIPKCNIKDSLSNEVNFINNLINQLGDNLSTQPNQIESNLVLEVKIFEILLIFIKKNNNLRKYLFKIISFQNFIDKTCLKKASFMLTFLKSKQDVSKLRSSQYLNIFNNQLNYLISVFNFLREFISKDSKMINFLKTNCNNIENTILLVIENYDIDLLSKLTASCGELYETAYKNGIKNYNDVISESESEEST